MKVNEIVKIDAYEMDIDTNGVDSTYTRLACDEWYQNTTHIGMMKVKDDSMVQKLEIAFVRDYEKFSD